MRKTCVFLAVFVSLCLTVLAQSDSVRPSVSVVGEANMEISPDQVVFTFEVVTTDKQVVIAKQANDISSAKTLSAAKAFSISSDDIQTARLTVSPRYSGDKDPRGAHILLGYEVTKRILITLKDLSKIDSFLARVIEAGVNRIVDISIENSRMQVYQEQVRAMAVKNARDKAEVYAKQLGQTIGKAYIIREEDADNPAMLGYSNGSGNGNGIGDGDAMIAHLETPTAFSSEVTFALGKISVEEKIYVTFALTQ